MSNATSAPTHQRLRPREITTNTAMAMTATMIHRAVRACFGVMTRAYRRTTDVHPVGSYNEKLTGISATQMMAAMKITAATTKPDARTCREVNWVAMPAKNSTMANITAAST